MTIAKLPLAKDIDAFNFTDTPIKEALVRDRATDGFVADQRNVVLSAAPEPARPTSPSPWPARSPLSSNQWRLNGSLRNGTRGRLFNVVDLVNRPETETRGGKQGRMADYMTRLDFVILDELGYLRLAQSGGPLRLRENSPQTVF
jgi:IstB-like ATP binding protein